MKITTPKEFADSDLSDLRLARVLGRTLGRATILLVLIPLVACAVAASLVGLPR